MSQKSTALKLHQTLHGYSDGHQLLANSVELSREQQWQMLVMSDLSGPSFRSGFDGYLTGYPLDGGGFYCFSKTWFAPELPRPGCVWTHTLLVRDSDVARIRDVRSLFDYFRRPVSANDYQGYDVVVDANLGEQADALALDAQLSSALIALLYGSPEIDVVLTTESSANYEDAIPLLFGQQWPRLRRRFRFCTGALSIREVRFDFAIAPPNVVQRHGEKSPTFNDLALAGISDGAKDEWIALAADDLCRREPTPFRKFLWTFGPDYGDGRPVYRALAELFLATAHEAQGIEEALSAVGHFFPEPESSRRLKASLFGIDSIFSRARGEAVTLEGLVTHPASSSVPDDVAMVGNRAAALVADDLQIAAKIATTSAEVGGGRAQEYLDGFLRGISAGGAIANVPRELLLQLVRREPNLLTRPDVWRTLREQQQHLAGMLWSLSRDQQYAQGVVCALIDAQTWDALGGALACYGADGVTAALRWIDGQEVPLSVPTQMIQALRENRSVIARVLAAEKIGHKAILAATVTLDPRSAEVRDVPTAVWSEAAGHAVVFAEAHSQLRSKAFLLSLGLSSDAPTAVTLVREAFSDVYEGAKQGGGLDHSLWGFIEPYLPWSRMTWDRCQRLIRGVVGKFVDHQWQQEEFLTTFRSAEQLERALDEATRTFRGSRYARSVCESAKQFLPAADPRRRVAADFCESSGNA